MKSNTLILAAALAWAGSLSARGEAGPVAEVSGLTAPIMDVVLSAPVAGTVSARLVQEGDFVQKGKVIMELDKKLEELNVTRRKLVVDTLKTDFEGTQHLFETTKSVSKDDLSKKELEYKVAVVDYDTAVEQLRKRLIISPIDGYITQIIPEVGEDCKAQDQMVRVVDTRKCYFICNVDARAGAGLKAGLSAKLLIDSGKTQAPFQGKVSFVSPVVDPASGLLKVKILFDNPDGKIRPGVAGKFILEAAADAN
jgi:RND family efflux transporter MFP subunit